MLRKLTSLVFLSLLTSLGSVQAQWRTETFDLVSGWQAIYLRVDPGTELIDNITAAHPEIEEIWRWIPNALDSTILDDPDNPVSGTEWEIWRKGSLSASTFTTLSPHNAYLVKIADNTSDFTFSIKGKVVPPRISWRVDGLNLLGFPVKTSETPTVNAYFAGDEIIGQDTEIYAYKGGPLITDVNPAQLTERFSTIKRGAAYWVRTAEFLDYDGPLRVRSALQNGLSFGSTGATVRLILTNRTSFSQEVTLAPKFSETNPSTNAGSRPVPLTIRETDSEGNITFTPMPSSHSISLQAGQTLGITLGIDRKLMPGSVGDEVFSLLKVTDGRNLSEFYLPVTATVSSLAGLWIGQAEVTHVQNQLQQFQTDDDGNYLVDTDGKHIPVYETDSEGDLIAVGDNELNPTAQRFPLNLIVHVDATGQARILSHVYHGAIAVDSSGSPVFGIGTTESALSEEYLDSAIRFSVVHLPQQTNLLLSGSFDVGSQLSGSLAIAHDSPSNPFVHTYHPDHDNLDARFENKLAAGIESFRIDRAFTLTLDSNSGTITDPSWGTTLVTGIYAETISGIHKNSIAVSGIFALTKISDIPTITTP